MLMLLCIGLSVAAATASSCDLILEQNVGFTANGRYYAKRENQSVGECCAWCSEDSACAAFTVHTKSGLCSIAKQITLKSGLTDTTSGRKKKTPTSRACNASAPSKRAAADAPNIALVLCDDLDLQLGGMTPLTKARRLLGDGGATATKWFIHTPVCCPSRGELLTGRYFHNVRTATPDAGPQCMFIDIEKDGVGGRFYDDYYFAPHLQQAGYTVGIFGKHMNNGNPKCPPPGVDQWMANGGGSYHAPTFSVASAGDADGGHSETWANCSYPNAPGWNADCYSTSVIGNASIAWIDAVQATEEADRKPFFAYIAVKAPHIEDGPGWPVTIPAPWYEDAFSPALQAPRTSNWNVTYPDHHWLIRQQPPMTMEQANKSDVLYRTRWQALLSVDDLVADVVSAVERAAAANGRKGYVIFSSDHGYRFGQFRMPQGKWNVYENDISIPWLIMGPGVAPGSTFSHIASQVDTMPTILGLAGVDTPSTMDGRSLAPLLLSAALDEAPSTARAHVARERAVGRGTRAAWRTEQLIEYYGLGPVIRYEHMEDNPNNTFRALRVYDEAQPAGRRNVKLVQFTGQENWNFSAAVATYPYEWELFDIDRDPSETTNLYAAADKTWLAALFASLEKLYACQGATCN